MQGIIYVNGVDELVSLGRSSYENGQWNGGGIKQSGEHPGKNTFQRIHSGSKEGEEDVEKNMQEEVDKEGMGLHSGAALCTRSV